MLPCSLGTDRLRKARFASLSSSGPEAVAPLSLGDLLLFDFLAAEGQYDERVAIERVRTLAHSALFLLAAHLTCAAALTPLVVIVGRAFEVAWLFLPLSGVLILDGAFWYMTRRHRTRTVR